MDTVKNGAISFTPKKPEIIFAYRRGFKQRKDWPIVNRKGTAVWRSYGPFWGFSSDADVGAFTSSFCFLVTLICSSCCARRLLTLVELDAVISSAAMIFESSDDRSEHEIPVMNVSCEAIVSNNQRFSGVQTWLPPRWQPSPRKRQNGQ